MTKFEELQSEHQRLLKTVGENKGTTHLEAVQSYIEKAKSEAQFVSSPRDRNQLRAILRYWGSWVYDRTTVFPDTTLRPAREEETPPGFFDQLRARAGAWLWAALGLVALLAVLFVVAALALASFKQPMATPPPVPTVTQASLNLPTSAPAVGSVGGPTPSSLETGPTQPVLPTPTAVKNTPPATIVPQIKKTQALPPSLPGQPTLPNTGGGGLGYIPAKVTARGVRDCQMRTLILTSAGELAPTQLNVPPAQVEVSLAESSRVVFSGALPFDQRARLEIPLREPTSNQTYLVKVEYPLPFEALIVTFPADCSRNEVTVTYDFTGLKALYPQLAGKVRDEASQPVNMDWKLINWGPVGDSGQWTATIQLQARGAGQNASYWDLLNKTPVSLPDQQMVVIAEECSPSFLLASVSSQGHSATEEVHLSMVDADCK